MTDIKYTEGLERQLDLALHELAKLQADNARLLIDRDEWFALGQAKHHELAKLRAERDALVGACGDLGANLVARDDELAKLRAAVTAIKHAWTDGQDLTDVRVAIDAACELLERPDAPDAETRINARIKQNPDMG